LQETPFMIQAVPRGSDHEHRLYVK
jgi:hypothetical protein